ncbi:polyketide cyclase [Nitriliruptoraceae bacterium ZYF776]|nr:polyketide cyclase [Profundirhabdus halotolerans]
MRRRYATHAADLWEAVTDRDRLPRWFLPVSGDLEVGGRYQLEGNAGGTIEACEPPRSFAATWEYADQVSWIRVRLTPDGDETVLELAHEAPVGDPEFWDTYGPGAAGIGWDLGLLGLGLHLETDGAPVDPQAAQAWAISEEGVAFVCAAAQRWADAAIADGDDPGAARAAAEATVAFYTVPPS